MIEDLKPEKVIVDRGIGSQFEATTDHMVFADIPDKENPQVVRKGPLLGIAVKMLSGHVLFAQPQHLTPA